MSPSSAPVRLIGRPKPSSSAAPRTARSSTTSGRRRPASTSSVGSTGGGAVLVAPGAQVWLDVWVPRGHPLWDDDVIGAAAWLGHAWVGALTGLGAGPLGVHRGPLAPTAWSDRICFAGFGPGEVFVADRRGDGGPPPSPGAKVVGLAQRRTRPVPASTPPRRCGGIRGRSWPSSGRSDARVRRRRGEHHPAIVQTAAIGLGAIAPRVSRAPTTSISSPRWNKPSSPPCPDPPVVADAGRL